MDRIELAERRYREILPPDGAQGEFPVRKLTAWLADDVGAVVHDYARRARFREYATWPLVAFKAESGSEARRRVDEVSAALARHARAVRAFLRTPRGRAAAAGLQPQQDVEEEVVIGGQSGSRVVRRVVTDIDPLPAVADRLEVMARPFWSDLVCPDDYFRPTGGWLERNPVRGGPTAGEFVAAFNPELPPVGDLVTRCLFRRVEIFGRDLEEIRQPLLTSARTSGRPPTKPMAELTNDAGRLDEALRRLNEACWPAGDGPLRDSCVTLTQAYATFHRSPDVGWLGLSEALVATGAGVLRHRLTNAHSREAVDRIAAALGGLKQLYADGPPGESALDEAIARGGLVLVEHPPTAYWAGRKIEAEWGRHKTPWKFLWVLAEKGRLGADVGEADVYDWDETKEHSAMAALFGRLKKLIPPPLCGMIVPGMTPRTYRLTLDPQAVYISRRPA